MTKIHRANSACTWKNRIPIVNSPISPVNFRNDFHLKFQCLILRQSGAQKLPSTLQQWQHHLPQVGEFVILAFLKMTHQIRFPPKVTVTASEHSPHTAASISLTTPEAPACTPPPLHPFWSSLWCGCRTWGRCPLPVVSGGMCPGTKDRIPRESPRNPQRPSRVRVERCHANCGLLDEVKMESKFTGWFTNATWISIKSPLHFVHSTQTVPRNASKSLTKPHRLTNICECQWDDHSRAIIEVNTTFGMTTTIATAPSIRHKQ